MLISLAQFCTRRRKAVIGGWIALLVRAGWPPRGRGHRIQQLGSAAQHQTPPPRTPSWRRRETMPRRRRRASLSGTRTTSPPSPRRHGPPSCRCCTRWPKSRGSRKVISPFTAAGAAEISKDGHTAYATVIFSSTKHAGEAKTLAKDVSNAQLSVETGDTAFTKVGGAGASDVIGVLAALADPDAGVPIGVGRPAAHHHRGRRSRYLVPRGLAAVPRGDHPERCP